MRTEKDQQIQELLNVMEDMRNDMQVEINDGKTDITDKEGVILNLEREITALNEVLI